MAVLAVSPLPTSPTSLQLIYGWPGHRIHQAHPYMAALSLLHAPVPPRKQEAEAVQHSSCDPIPGDGIHQPQARSPSPDPGMAIPRLGPSPGSAIRQPAERAAGQKG